MWRLEYPPDDLKARTVEITVPTVIPKLHGVFSLVAGIVLYERDIAVVHG